MKIKDGAIDIKNSEGETVFKADEKSAACTKGEIQIKDWKADDKTLGYIMSKVDEHLLINLGNNPTFLIDDNKYTFDDLLSKIADKVVEKINLKNLCEKVKG